MNGPAKDAYHAYHVALGTKDAKPFEWLTPLETEAWANVAGVAQKQFEKLENAYQDLHDKTVRVEELEELLHRANQRVEGLQDELKAARLKPAARKKAPAK